VVPLQTMEDYGGLEVGFHLFVTSAQDGPEWLPSRPGRCTKCEGPRVNHWIGASRAGRFGETENRFLSCGSHQVLPVAKPPYRPRHPG